VDATLADAGFDIVHRFDAAAVSRELAIDLGGPLGILIGNTRALWPIFLARADLGVADPLDRYTERVIEAVVPPDARAWFAHRRYAGAFLPFQRIAVAAGLGTRSPTELVIHPSYGPWFALRAVIACDGIAPRREPLPPVCSCEARCHDAMTRAVAAKGPDNWRCWLAVRDACTIGQTHRYGDDQIIYHYTKRMLGRGM
jgi:methylmalonic aciduria homocystinuria type C protein